MWSAADAPDSPVGGMVAGFNPDPSRGCRSFPVVTAAVLCAVPADLTRMIHILDTEHPWDVHSVNSEHSEAITCLEWDQSGEARPGHGGSCMTEGDSDALPRS